MTPSKRSARFIAIALCLLTVAVGLAGCKTSSTRPSIAPTAPQVTCDRTPPAQPLAHVPPFATDADIPANDAWKADTIGKYQVEVTIRRQEHACWDDLRARGVIR